MIYSAQLREQAQRGVAAVVGLVTIIIIFAALLFLGSTLTRRNSNVALAPQPSASTNSGKRLNIGTFNTTRPPLRIASGGVVASCASFPCTVTRGNRQYACEQPVAGVAHCKGNKPVDTITVSFSDCSPTAKSTCRYTASDNKAYVCAYSTQKGMLGCLPAR